MPRLHKVLLLTPNVFKINKEKQGMALMLKNLFPLRQQRLKNDFPTKPATLERKEFIT